MSEKSKFQWSDFKKIDGLNFELHDFCETLDGGQAFTWYPISSTSANINVEFDKTDTAYTGVFGNTAAIVKRNKNGNIYASSLISKNADSNFEERIKDYLDFSSDYEKIRKSLHSSRDEIMRKALLIHPTLRILRQDPTEAIICFICSSSKRIIQIKQCVKLLSENLGDEIGNGFYSLPTLEKIANADIETIKACKLGFRAAYLHKSAQKMISDKFSPHYLREMPYPEAKKYLVSLSGIGEKVADCILLFGASRFEAFPVDTWIKQAMTQLYSTPEDANKIREFATLKFGSYAGFAQQLIFSAIRKNLI